MGTNNNRLTRIVKKSALSNAPTMDEMRTEVIRISGIAAEALKAASNTSSAATKDQAAATDPAANDGDGLLKQNGWWDFPGGLQVRWGRATLPNGGKTKINFVEKFSNACFVVIAGGTNASGDNAQDNAADVYTTTPATTASFEATCARDGTTICHYLAIGY